VLDDKRVPLYCDTDEKSGCILGKGQEFLFVCYIEANRKRLLLYDHFVECCFPFVDMIYRSSNLFISKSSDYIMVVVSIVLIRIRR
jgi:hypothetical protein